MASCFRVDPRCSQPCHSSDDCTDGLQCIVDTRGGVCGRAGDTCGKHLGGVGGSSGSGGDAATSAQPDLADATAADVADAVIETAATPDVPPEAPSMDADGGVDVDGSSDTEAGPDTPDGDDGDVNCHTGRIEPPMVACTNGHCLPLTPAMRDGAVLWLDPSNLGPMGSEVPIWCDQSGKQNEAYAVNEDFLPFVTRGGGVSLAATESGAGFGVLDSPSLNLGAGDFTLLVVAGINLSGARRTFFSKKGGDQAFPKQVVLESFPSNIQSYRPAARVNETSADYDVETPPGPERLYGLRQMGDKIEIRVNGMGMMNAVTLATPGASTENDGDLYLGIAGYIDPVAVDTLRAVILIRGSLSDREVGDLESHLRAAFNL